MTESTQCANAAVPSDLPFNAVSSPSDERFVNPRSSLLLIPEAMRLMSTSRAHKPSIGAAASVLLQTELLVLRSYKKRNRGANR